MVEKDSAKHVGWSVSLPKVSEGTTRIWHIGKLPKAKNYSIYCELLDEKLNVTELVPIAYFNTNAFVDEFIEMTATMIEFLATPTNLPQTLINLPRCKHPDGMRTCLRSGCPDDPPKWCLYEIEECDKCYGTCFIGESK